MTRADRLAVEEAKAWELFKRRQRLAVSAWKRYERAAKAAERASDKELEREAAQGDVHEVLREQARQDRVAAAGNLIKGVRP